ncbi:hypothetical protein EUA37_02515 [Neisseria meningitidis]|nr:hypothetical protein EUA37_02515 [Neisseria meningitidis]
MQVWLPTPLQGLVICYRECSGFYWECKVFLSPAKPGNCEMKNKNSYLSIYIKFLIDKKPKLFIY